MSLLHTYNECHCLHNINNNVDHNRNKHKCAQKVAKEDVCWYIFVCVVVSLHDLLYVISAKKVLSVLGESNIDLILISLLELSPYSLNVFM